MSGDYSDIWNEVTRKARKDHWCISGCKIKKGETYTRISSLYDGHWDTWNVHPRFQEWLNKVNEFVSDEDSRVGYWDFLERDLSFKELAELRFIMIKADSKILPRMAVSYRMDLMWKDMQHQKEIDRFIAIIADLENKLAEKS